MLHAHTPPAGTPGGVVDVHEPEHVLRLPLDDETPAGLLDGTNEGVDIEGTERDGVEHLDVDTVRCQLLRGGQCPAQHVLPSHDRQLRSGTTDRGATAPAA